MDNAQAIKAVAKTDESPAARFTNAVMREFVNVTGAGIVLSEEQKRLAQHLFLKIDSTLKELETKRLGKPTAAETKPISWQNVNMPKLAVDAMYRIDLQLDAFIPNHISPIPYWNSREGKYDLDLRVGYAGKNFYKRVFALDPPKQIIYELVYSTDKFKVNKKGLKNDVENYEFTITNPFERGEVTGGFGYVMYDDPTKNFVLPVSEKEFKRREKMGKASNFWTDNPEAMRYKTIVNIVTGRLQQDPRKITPSYKAVEASEFTEVEAQVQTEIEQSANKEELPPPTRPSGPTQTPPPQPEKLPWD